MDDEARPAESIHDEAKSILAALRSSPFARALPIRVNPDLQYASIFDAVPSDQLAGLRSAADELLPRSPQLSRARGALVALAVADGLGHNFEFLPVRDFDPKESDPGETYFEYPSKDSTPGGTFHRPLNQFSLRPGQWTDDASMALCLADSLLSRGGFDGSNVREWFWNWWNCGLNNAFRDDADRRRAHERFGLFVGGSMSIGLGGNISSSLNEIDELAGRGRPVPPHFQSDTEDAGNGSLMRLAPVPLCFHGDIERARAVAIESSLTTHPGPLAAEACAFLAHVIVRAIHRSPSPVEETAAQFLDRTVEEYVRDVLDTAPDGHGGAKAQLRRLLASAEPDDSTERCWNWRSYDLGVIRTLQNRGRNYNGYPVSAEYFGSFSFDGLALALHCVYHTTSLNGCIYMVVNYRGDADTTGAISAQIAGSFYGIEGLDVTWRQNLERWDRGGEIDARAVLLFTMGESESDVENEKSVKKKCVAAMDSTVSRMGAGKGVAPDKQADRGSDVSLIDDIISD